MRDYDKTVAKIAGNIMGPLIAATAQQIAAQGGGSLSSKTPMAAQLTEYCVDMARHIVQRVRDTEIKVG